MNEELRRLFPIAEKWIYLNHASVSPPSTLVVEAVNRQLRDAQMFGSLNYKDWVAAKENCRRLLAKMFNVRAEQIAFLRNTSDALSCIANGLQWRTGDNIVTFAKDFPSNVYPWRRIRDVHGVELRLCPERDGRIDLDEFCDLIDENTRLISISAVQYASGFRADLRQIAAAARKVDALFVVDAIQAAGVVPLDFPADGVDAAAGACHKWLLAPEGLGYLYLSKRARARIEPTLVGWISAKHHENFDDLEQDYKSGALAWETGTFASSLFYGLETCLQLFEQIGVNEVNRYLLELTDYLCDNLPAQHYQIVSSRRENEKSPMVCIRHKGGTSPHEIAKRLQHEHNIIVIGRGDRLRISPHIYNTKHEIDLLIEGLTKIG